MKTPFRSLMLIATVALVALAVEKTMLPQAEAATPGSSVREALAGSMLGAAKFSALLTWDAGLTGTSSVKCLTNTAGGASTNQTVIFEQIPAAGTPNGVPYCYKTCTSSTCVPNCTKDFVIGQSVVSWQTPDAGAIGYTFTNQPGALISDPIQMGSDSCFVISSLDAGAISVNAYTVTKNP